MWHFKFKTVVSEIVVPLVMCLNAYLWEGVYPSFQKFKSSAYISEN